MIYEANIYQMTVEEHVFWVTESRVLKGCVGQGETSDEAISELESNELEWIETAEEVGIPVPDPVCKNADIPSGKFALRLSPNIYSESCRLAEELGISVNQHFSNAIAEYNANCKAYLRRPVSAPDVESVESTVVDITTRLPIPPSFDIQQTDDLEEM